MDTTNSLLENEDLSDLDYIFHLASPASPVDYQNFSEETLLSNSLGTLK
jgi:nucleoside-diphosphate-sugar epimerase